MNFRKKPFLGFILLLFLAIGTVYYKETIISDVSKVQQREAEDTSLVNANSSLKIYFLDVGQADSILLSNNGEYMLIDAGNNEDGEKLVSYFQELGITNFSYVIGTHAHEDHIGGMDDIIYHFGIQTFYMPDVITTTKTFENVLDALEEKSITFETPEMDGTFAFGDCKFQVLYVGDETKDLNDSSIVLHMNYGNHSFLFMGDATSKIEKEIILKDLASDVLKVGHHGSRYSTAQAFLDKVSPKYAIISAGVNNSYHHPHASTLKKLQESAISIYRTDRDGTIIVSSDGTNLTFETLSTDTNG